MGKQFRIKVAEGRKIRDPKTGSPLPQDRAIQVDATSYWMKRISKGDVVLVDEKKVEPKKNAVETFDEQEQIGD